jgi:hypothetical protein
MKREAFAVQRRWPQPGAGVVLWVTIALFDVHASAQQYLETVGGPRPKRVQRVWINSGPIPSGGGAMIPFMEDQN